jgi:mannose-P-dolichol utilization defect 1
MRSTGQLSLVAVLAQILGCLARLFTTATEVGEGGGILAASFAVALVLNLWLGWQMYAYWGRDAGGVPVHVKEKDIAMMELPRQERVDIVVPLHSPSPVLASSSTVSAGYGSPPVSRTGSPVPRASSTPGRKWARKVD